jgi:hypothetical protein
MEQAPLPEPTPETVPKAVPAPTPEQAPTQTPAQAPTPEPAAAPAVSIDDINKKALKEAAEELDDIKSDGVTTLKVDEYNRVDIPTGSWAFYKAVLQGNGEKINDGSALKLAEAVTKNLQANTIYNGLIEELVKKEQHVTDGISSATVDNIISQIDSPDKDILEESIKLQARVPNSGVYVKDCTGEAFKDAPDYISKLSTLCSPGDLTSGPKAYPDLLIIGNEISDIKNLDIRIYIKKDNKYAIAVSLFADQAADTDTDTTKTISILYENRDTFAILTPKNPGAPAVGKVREAMNIAKIQTELSSEMREKLASVQSPLKIGNEMVVMDDTAPYSGQVSFKDAFFPKADETPNLLDNAKIIFNKVFYNGNSLDKNPPCDKNELAILMGGLRTRITTLSDDISELRRGPISIEHNLKVQHLSGLHVLIQSLEENIDEGQCTDYQDINYIAAAFRVSPPVSDGTTTPINDSDDSSLAVYKSDGSPLPPSKLDAKSSRVYKSDKELEERVRTLLRQFAFMVLQAENPHPDYANKTEDAKEIIEILEENMLSRAEMDDYITLWRAQVATTGENIPEILVEVLGKTDTQTSLLDHMMEDQLNSLLNEVIAAVNEDYMAVAELGTKFNEFIAGLHGKKLESKEKVKRLIKWVINENKDNWKKLGDIQAEIQSVEKRLKTSTDEVKVLEEKVRDAETAKVNAEKVLSEKTKTMEADAGKSAETAGQLAALQAVAATQKQESDKKITDLTTLRDASLREIEDLKKGLQEVKSRANPAEAAAAAAIEANKALAREVATHKQTIDTLTLDSNKIKTQLADAEKNVAFLTGKSKEAEAARDAANAASVTAAEAAESKMKAAVTDRDRLQRLYDEQLQTNKTQKDDFDKKTATLQESLKMSEATQTRINAELAAAIVTKGELNTQLSALQRISDEKIRGQSADTEKRLAETAAKIVSLEAAQKTALSEKEDIIKRLVEEKMNATIAAADAEKKLKIAGDSQNTSIDSIITEIGQFAKNITNGKEYAVPTNLPEGAQNAFAILKTNIEKMKPSAASPSNQICFLSYFIMFFMKILFFMKDNKEARQSVMNSLETVASRVIVTLQKKGGDVKQILYKILEVLFGLLDASESLYISRQTREGHIPSDIDIGISVIKTTAEPDPEAQNILQVIHDEIQKLDTQFQTNLNILEQSLMTDLKFTHPKVRFNLPMVIDAMISIPESLRIVTKYPSFTYMPATAKIDSLPTRVQVIDIPAGYTKTKLDIADLSIQHIVASQLKKTTLPYMALFAVFVVFGRKYIVAAKDDFSNKYKCKIPSILENYESFKQTLEPEPLPKNEAADLLALRSAAIVSQHTQGKRIEQAKRVASYAAPTVSSLAKVKK